MKCPYCRAELNHCYYCGSPLSNDDLLSEAAAELVVRNSAGDISATFRLSRASCVIGRHDPFRNQFPEIDLTSFDPKSGVSRCHARLHHRGGKFFVEDLKSLNGTYLIERGQVTQVAPHQLFQIRNGSKLRFGGVEADFLLPEGS